MNKRFSIASVVFFICAICALAQSTTPTQSSTSGTQAAANSGSEAVINNNSTTNSSAPRQFLGAVPGLYSPGAYPGFPILGTDWQLYCPASLPKTLPMASIRSMAHGARAKVNWAAIFKGSASKDDPMKIACWWPKSIPQNPGDQIIGTVVVEQTDDVRLLERYVARAWVEARDSIRSDRVAILVRSVRLGKTSGRSFGGSANFSRITAPTTDNDGVGFAVGGLIGTNTTQVVEHFIIEAVALNPGSVEMPPKESTPPAQQAPAAPAPPAQTAAQAGGESSNPTPDFDKLSNAIDRFTKRIEALNRPMPPAPQTPPPEPPAPAPQASACSGLPDFSVHFDWDKDYFIPTDLPGINRFAEWLIQHPNCSVQIEGYADTTGDADYNAALARRRTYAVSRQLIADGVSKTQIVRNLSGGKDFPIGSRAESRRVIVSIRGPASGK